VLLSGASCVDLDAQQRILRLALRRVLLGGLPGKSAPALELDAQQRILRLALRRVLLRDAQRIAIPTGCCSLELDAQACCSILMRSSASYHCWQFDLEG
jgi:hypothetical protein